MDLDLGKLSHKQDRKTGAEKPCTKSTLPLVPTVPCDLIFIACFDPSEWGIEGKCCQLSL